MAIVDNLELFEFLKSYTNHWIGLYSRVGKRQFKWIDNTKVEFGKVEKQKPWGATEPSVKLYHYRKLSRNIVIISLVKGLELQLDFQFRT